MDKFIYVLGSIVGFIIGYSAAMLLLTFLAQWLWSIFCVCINCSPMSYWQMFSFIIFLSMFIVPRYVNVRK